eukprot:TRINITY_DN11575_c0_g1_i1.p1 TRINITY_DN11575_c0_g1~~TRINITY_DN11575_c0_g1_i1.p1  ORF type:complete len:1027 (+),score=269.64 TRINITY_DN11575_c0_g1_i1:148-3081(+)
MELLKQIYAETFGPIDPVEFVLCTEKKRSLENDGDGDPLCSNTYLQSKNRLRQWKLLNPMVYTKRDRFEMELLKQIYAETFGPIDPVEFVLCTEKKSFLDIEKTIVRPTFLVAPRNLEVNEWRVRLVNSTGIFKIFADDIISLICDYQVYERDRHIRKMMRNKPQTLFCEEFKRWALERLSTIICSEETYREVENRILYLERILVAEDLFDSDKGAEKTLQEQLRSIWRILKYKVFPLLDKAKNNNKTCQLLKQLKLDLSFLIGDSVYFLYYVFRKGEKDSYKPFVLEQLVSDEAKYDSHSKLFRKVVVTDPIKSILCPHILDAPTVPKEILEKASLSASFIDLQASTIHITPDILPDPQENISSPNVPLSDEILKSFSEENSGIEPGLKDVDNLKLLFTTLAQITFLGKMWIHLDRIISIEENGTYILGNVRSNVQINASLSILLSIVGGIWHNLCLLKGVADIRFGYLVASKKSSGNQPFWMNHFNQLSRLLRNIKTSMYLIEEISGKIRALSNVITFYASFQSFPEDVLSILMSFDNLCEQISKSMDYPYIKFPLPPVIKLPDDDIISTLNFIMIKNVHQEVALKNTPSIRTLSPPTPVPTPIIVPPAPDPTPIPPAPTPITAPIPSPQSSHSPLPSPSSLQTNTLKNGDNAPSSEPINSNIPRSVPIIINPIEKEGASELKVPVVTENSPTKNTLARNKSISKRPVSAQTRSPQKTATLSPFTSSFLPTQTSSTSPLDSQSPSQFQSLLQTESTELQSGYMNNGEQLKVFDLVRTETQYHKQLVLEISKMSVSKEEPLVISPHIWDSAKQFGKNHQVKPFWTNGFSLLSGTSPMPRWHHKEKEKWIPFTEEVSKMLEDAWQDQKEVKLISPEMSADLYERKVKIDNKEHGLLRATWFVEDDDGNWLPYSEDIAEGLERCAQKYDQWNIKISDKPKERIVVGSFKVFRQFRRSSKAKPEGRTVLRGYEAKLINL